MQIFAEAIEQRGARIDPQIVLDAVKDAMLIAARKHYRTNEDYFADMDPKTGAIQLYAVKKVVEAVEDPVHEMILAEARRIDPNIEVGAEVRIQKNTEALAGFRRRRRSR